MPLPVFIAWQGIQLRLPNDWFLNGFSGDWREGVLTISSAGKTHLDIKWVRSKARSDLQFHLQRFLKQLERDARKRGARFTGTIEPQGEQSLRFRWSGHEQAVGRIRRCPDCQCITLMQLRSTARHEPLHTLAAAIFETLVDHPDAEGWVEWSLYGLHTAVPERFRLESHAILTGQTRLHFRLGRERLTIERIARAEQLMRGWSMPDWAQAWLHWHRWHGAPEPFEFEADPALLWQGRLRFGGLISESLQSLLTLRLPAWRIRAIAWFCPERNALFHIVHQSSRRTPLLDEVMARTVCH
ncbi:hypothetical protein HRbin15_01549 [bacterium HR15]|nr:hypothetical protein HRbin15_01549 [bacterium HR15]